MIREELVLKIERAYEKRKAVLGSLKEVIDEKINKQKGLCAVLCKYIYAYLPLSDLGNYDFELFLSYAEHGCFLYENSPYLKGVPDEMFLNYVVSPRINTEDLTDCRRFFYDMVKDRIEGMDIEEATLSLNNFAYENATYHSTSERTASPITVYKGGYGRCGEESTFYVSVLRSVGIPARQIYVPRWSHSDSNHAWTEIFLGDKWVYTGACEPKPVFNCGWFPYAASRAMVVHSRVFGDLIEDDSYVTGTEGIVSMVNNGELYLKQKLFKVKVIDENKKPVEGAKVRFEIVNSGELFTIVSGVTDNAGNYSIRLGLGSVHVYVSKGPLKGYGFYDVENCDEAEVVLSEKEIYDTTPFFTEFNLRAPASSYVSEVVLTADQEKLQAGLNERADELRNGRTDSHLDKDYLSRYKDYTEIVRVLKNARGNFDEIRAFLEKEIEGVTLEYKNRLLSSLSQKDARDITCSILADAVEAYKDEAAFKAANPGAPLKYRGSFVDNEAVMDSADIMDEFYRADMDFFTEYIAAPRISTEKFSTWRADLKEIFKEEKGFNSPEEIWEYVDKNITEDEKEEYSSLITAPAALLKLKRGTGLSKEVLFVAICRAFNIAARLDMTYKKAQYFCEDGFVFADKRFDNTAAVTFVFKDREVPEYCSQYSLSYRKEGGDYYVLNNDRLWLNKEKEVEVELAAGDYRLLTCERLLSGSISGKVMYFHLEKGDNKSIEIQCRSDKGLVDDKDRKHIGKVTLNSFTEDRKTIGEGVHIYMFLKAGEEPTEHVLNELMELHSMDKALGAPLHILINDEKELSNDLMGRVLVKIEHSTDRIDEEAVSKLLFKKKDELTGYPYICLTKDEDLLFTTNGYQVGIVDLLQRMSEELSDR